MTFFKIIREIRSKKGQLVFRRFAIVKCNWFAIYIHQIHRADTDLHLHNHPWNMLTMVLKGAYWEDTLDSRTGELKTKLTSWKSGLRFYKAKEIYHKISGLFNGAVTTVAFTGRRLNDEWGYYVRKDLLTKEFEHIPNKRYREMKEAGAFNASPICQEKFST